MTSSIIETMTNIRTTPMSMKTVMKKRRRKTEEKKEKLMNMSKMNKLMKTRAGVEIKPNVPLAWGMSSPEKLLVPKKNH